MPRPGRVDGDSLGVEKSERSVPIDSGAVVAHEINNPLTSLIKLLYLIRTEV